MTVVALVSDLMTRSHLAGAAARSGVDCEIVASVEALEAAVESVQPSLVVIDLSHPGIAPRETIPRIKQLLSSKGVVVAFGPHVHHDLLDRARAAGCQAVLSRGQFYATVEEFLDRHGR